MNRQDLRLCALWCGRQLLTLGLVLLVLVAALVGLSRQLLPLADDYRSELEAALSARLGLPVTLQRLEGRMEGAQLRLRLVQLELHDPRNHNVLLAVPEAELRPAIWQSLWQGELRVDLRLRGLAVHIDQQPDGRLQLRELSGVTRSAGGSGARTLGLVLRQPALSLRDSRVSLSLQALPAISLEQVNLLNRNDGSRHQLAGRARLAGSEELALQMDYRGDPLQWQQGQLRLWIQAPVLDLTPWLPAVAGRGLDIRRLQAGGSYWLDFQQGRLMSARAQLDWRELALQRGEVRHRLSNLRGLLGWQRHGSGWELAVQQLQGHLDGHGWPLPQLAIRSASGAMSVAVAHARIDGVRQLLEPLPVPAVLRTWLREAAPAGHISRLRADLAARPEGGWRLQRLDAEGRQLSVRSNGRLPGGHGLAGWLRWTPERAWAGLDSRGVGLTLPRLLREPLMLSGLQGQLRLTREGAGWRLDSDRVQLSNTDLKATGVVSLSLLPGTSPRLSLLGSLRDGRVASAWRYLPDRPGSERLADWLRSNLRGGRVPRGDIVYEGALRPDPDTDPARLLMRFAVQQGRLDYAPDWPGLRELDATVVLDGSRLEVAGSRARLLDDSQAGEVRALIADLREPELQVAAELTSTGADINRLFAESRLQTLAPGLSDVLALEGPLSGQISLSLPLRGGPAQVAVAARLQDNLLRLKPAGLIASRLQGELHYSTASGLRASRLEAQLLEAPVQADIQTTARHETIVNLVGTASVPALRRWLASSLLDMASGSAAYQARVSIPRGAAPHLQLESSLVGLRLRVPAPLGKAAQEPVPLRYHSSLGGKEQMARLQYGQRLSAGLVWQGARLDRALLRLDSTAAAWPLRSGLEIEGRLARLDLGEWRPWLQRFQQPAQRATVSARGEASMPSLNRLELEAGELLAEGWRISNARLAMGRATAGWQLAVDSHELAGMAQLPDAPGSEINLSFSRLQWPLPLAGTGGAGAGTGKAGLAPVSGLGNRPLQIQGEGLRLQAWPGLGSLAVRARLLPIPYGLRVDDLALRSPLLNFNGKMDWQWRGGAYTYLRGQAASGNVAGLLAALGQPPEVVSRRAEADFDLAWRGAPDKAALAALEGQVKLTLEEGRLLNVGTGATVSRIFGWFDLDNLQRRLRGDFADVTRRGLAFDRISLEGPLMAGVMQPATLAVSGPTLQVQGQGMMDLGRRKLDQRFAVTIPVSSAVPLAAVMMAGPVVGGAVAAAHMAFDKQIDKATQLNYHVSGDWTRPRVERLGSRPASPVAVTQAGGRAGTRAGQEP